MITTLRIKCKPIYNQLCDKNIINTLYKREVWFTQLYILTTFPTCHDESGQDMRFYPLLNTLYNYYSITYDNISYIRSYGKQVLTNGAGLQCNT